MSMRYARSLLLVIFIPARIALGIYTACAEFATEFKQLGHDYF